MDARASAAYHIAGRLRLRGRLDEGALVRALDRIVQRHEALRTRVVSVEGKPRQVIDPSQGFTLSRQEMAGASEAQLQEACEQEAQAPFDLAEGPLVRGRLIRLGEEDHVLLVTLHHIVCDGWSLGVLTKELSALYQAYRQGECRSTSCAESAVCGLRGVATAVAARSASAATVAVLGGASAWSP